MSLLTDPWRRSIALAVGLVVAGLVAITVAWLGVSATLSVPAQVSFAVSGGIGGFALAGAGLALFDVQRRRYDAAVERHELARLTEGLTDIAELVAARHLRRDTPKPARRRRVLQAR